MLQHPVRSQPVGLPVAPPGEPAPSSDGLPSGAPEATVARRTHLLAVLSEPDVQAVPAGPAAAVEPLARLAEAACTCPMHRPMDAATRESLGAVVREADRLRVVVQWVLGLALLGLLVLLM